MVVDVAVSGTVRLLGALSLFCLSLVVAHKLEADSAGLFFLALNIVMFLATVSRLGLDQIVLRITSIAHSEALGGRIKHCLGKALAVAVGSAMLLSACLWLGADWLANSVLGKAEAAPILKLIAPSIVGSAVLMLIAMSLQGMRRISTSVFVSHIALNLLMIAFLLSRNQLSPESTALGYSTLSFVASLACLGVWRWHSRNLPGPGKISFRELTASCLPLWIFMLMGQLVLWSGQIMAGTWVDPGDLALLAVAQRTAMIISFLLVAVNLVIAPKFAELYDKGRLEELEALTLKSVRLILVFAAPIGLVILMMPQTILSIFGDHYRSGSTLLQILVLGQLVNVVTGPVTFLLTMSGHDRDIRNVMLVSGPTAVLLGLLLIPAYGATGCAVSTAVAIATQHLLAAWHVRRRLGFSTLSLLR